MPPSSLPCASCPSSRFENNCGGGGMGPCVLWLCFNWGMECREGGMVVVLSKSDGVSSCDDL